MFNTLENNISIQKISIANDPDWYEAFPDVALAQSGRLVCVYAQCIHHGDRSVTQIQSKFSDDDGETWSVARAMTAQTSGELFYNCPRISCLRDGRLVFVIDYISQPGPAREVGNKTFIAFSDDEGDTWSDLIPTPIEGIVPDQLIETKQGRWLLAAHYKDQHIKRGIQRAWWTDDEGKTWSGPSIVGDLEGQQLCEGSIVEIDDVLVCFMRENSFDGRDVYKSMSFDQGQTWTTAIRFPLPGCHRPVAGVLQNGAVLITHRFMQGGKGWVGKWTQNTFAAITDKKSTLARQRGDSWSRIMPLDYDRSAESDTGYTGWVQLHNGDIFIVNYVLDDAPKGQIRGYRISPDMFTLPA